MILQCAAQVPTEDWRRMKDDAISVLGICSGLRPKELRLAKLKDLDLNNGMMHAEKINGKGRYGEPRDSAIHPDGPLFLRRYLQVRAQALMSEYLTSDLLLARRPDPILLPPRVQFKKISVDMVTKGQSRNAGRCLQSRLQPVYAKPACADMSQ
jgi:integrase